MGIFSTIWEYIKKAGKGIYNFFKKVFTYFYNGVKFASILIAALISLLQTNWVGLAIAGVKLLYELVQFFRSKGAKVDESYKDKLEDMDAYNNGEHQFNINVSP
jgi:hypothetical protein